MTFQVFLRGPISFSIKTRSALATTRARLASACRPTAACASTRLAGGMGGCYRLTTVAPMRDMLSSLNDGCNALVWWPVAAYSLVNAPGRWHR